MSEPDQNKAKKGMAETFQIKPEENWVSAIDQRENYEVLSLGQPHPSWSNMTAIAMEVGRGQLHNLESSTMWIKWIEMQRG